MATERAFVGPEGVSAELRPGGAALVRALALLIVGGGLFVAAVLLGPRVNPPPHVTVRPYAALAVLLTLFVAALPVARLPGHGVTRVVTALALCHLLGFGLDPIASALGRGWLSTSIRWAGGAVWAGTLPLLPVLIAVFPSGSPRWPRIFRIQMVALALVVVTAASGVSADTARGGVEVALAWAGVCSLIVLLVTGVVNAFALGVRWWRARGDERAQLCWFTVGALVLAVAYIGMALGYVIFDWTPSGVVNDLVDAYLIGGLPFLGVAVVRHRLYGIDVVVSRVLVWLTVSAVLLGLYGATVSLVADVIGAPAATSLPALLGVGVVALALAPLYRSVQAVVDRLMYGHRGHPDRALQNLAARLGGALAANEVPDRVVATVTSALHLSWVALDVRQDGGFERLAEQGTHHSSIESVPVLYGTEEVGRLMVCPRWGESRLSRRDLRVLGQLGTQVGVALNAGRLTDELARSRERLVLGREEERQRLRRDLHDNLSPALSGIALAAAAARGRVSADPAAAEQLLGRIEREASASAGSVGRLLAGLRPPALDELGLAGALRERIDADDGLVDTAIVMDIEDPLPAMSAAVELAAYRVVVEALANVFRHAQATTCTVRVAGANGHLAVEVSDDGRGVPDVHLDGVGLTSARERARDVGGSITVHPRLGGGTTLRTDLPLQGAR